MKKPDSLRAAIVAVNPEFERTPDNLRIFVRGGAVALRYGTTLGYEYRYQLVIEVRDFGGKTNEVFFPITVWIREHQPDLLLNPDRSNQAIKFEADMLDAKTVDIDITLNLTEAIDVTSSGTGFDLDYRDEPPVNMDRALSDPATTLQSLFDPAGQLLPDTSNAP